MANDFMDFDAFLSQEVKPSPHPYKLFGITGEIPANIPYGLILEYQAMAQRDKDSDVDTITVHRMMEYIFGAEVVTQWLKVPTFDAETMSTVLRWAMSKYRLVDDEEAPKEKTQRGKAKIVRLPSET